MLHPRPLSLNSRGRYGPGGSTSECPTLTDGGEIELLRVVRAEVGDEVAADLQHRDQRHPSLVRADENGRRRLAGRRLERGFSPLSSRRLTDDDLALRRLAGRALDLEGQVDGLDLEGHMVAGLALAFLLSRRARRSDLPRSDSRDSPERRRSCSARHHQDSPRRSKRSPMSCSPRRRSLCCFSPAGPRWCGPCGTA